MPEIEHGKLRGASIDRQTHEKAYFRRDALRRGTSSGYITERIRPFLTIKGCDNYR
jgi:hypothetical protein